jgi:hypothetical protein
MARTGRDIVVFDLGGVLIDRDPRHLYRELFAGDEFGSPLTGGVCDGSDPARASRILLVGHGAGRSNDPIELSVKREF